MLQGGIGYLYGTPLITDPYLSMSVQWRFPRSRKKRIRNKWKKQAYNCKDVPDTTHVYKTPHGFLCHPILADVLLKQQAREGY